MLSWASVMFAWNARPPHPGKFVGSDWKEAWRQRLEQAGSSWNKIWLEHQTYDDYWKGNGGSICEDYSRVSIPILAIGGWHDMYSNAVFRMVDNLPNCRGIIGPWSHDWPDVAIPGPHVRPRSGSNPKTILYLFYPLDWIHARVPGFLDLPPERQAKFQAAKCSKTDLVPMWGFEIAWTIGPKLARTMVFQDRHKTRFCLQLLPQWRLPSWSTSK